MRNQHNELHVIYHRELWFWRRSYSVHKDEDMQELLWQRKVQMFQHRLLGVNRRMRHSGYFCISFNCSVVAD